MLNKKEFLYPSIESERENKKEIADNFQSDATITFLRHGNPKYTEEEIKKCDFEGELTDEGKEQVKKSAKELAQEIKNNNEVVIVWSSSRSRADETSKIFINTLEEEGITVLDRKKESDNKYKNFTSLSAPDVTPEFWKQKPKDEFFVRIWKELYEKDELPKGVETPDESEKKFKRVLEYNRRVINIFNNKRRENRNFPKLRIIDVGHFETVTPIIYEAYGGKAGIDKEYGPEGAGFVNLEMQNLDDKSIIRLDYKRGAKGGENPKEDSVVYIKFDKERNLSKIK